MVSYARARLCLGICAVGTMVVVALLLLKFHIPLHLLSTQILPFGSEVRQLIGVLFLYTFLSAPFDLFGGYILPRKYGKTELSFPVFLRRWLRGVLLHSLLLLTISLVLLEATKEGGFALFLGAFVGVTITMIGCQAFVAQLLSGVRYGHFEEEHVLSITRENTTKRGNVITASSISPYFTGGITGLPGHELIILPEGWLTAFTSQQLAAIVLRRVGVLKNSSRTRGLLLAFGWNLLGFCLSGLLAGDVATVAGLVTGSLWFTIWNFLGLLLLPSPSQRGVFGADAFARQHGSDTHTLETVIGVLDRDQDDEYSRSRLVETYFHPLPSVERRIALLSSGSSDDIGAWHGARMAIYLSWAGVGFLSRAVHCNCGRPDVWVFLPSD